MIPVCSTDEFEAVSIDDDAIDRENSAIEYVDDKPRLKYEATRDMNDLAFFADKSPVIFVIRPLMKKEKLKVSRALVNTDPGDDSGAGLSDIALDLFARAVTDIKGWTDPDGNDVPVIKSKRDGNTVLKQETIEKVPMLVVVEIGLVVLKEMKLKETDKKK